MFRYEGSARVVEAIEGTESVLLPCSYSGQIPDEPLIIWSCSDFIATSVHLRRGEEDDLRDQNQHFRGRTSIKADALDTTDFSLTLKKPQISDNGYYACKISDGKEELILTTIHLKIKVSVTLLLPLHSKYKEIYLQSLECIILLCFMMQTEYFR
uniref:Ig-like domain-containing protein n=1 Tax=Fundulus heteroclitus TaxID=8078 RepID=A0A3Q2PGT8_FUNHE